MDVIYRITNMVNGKYYIGSTDAYERRVWQHRYALKRGVHANAPLQASWNKHGEEAFVFEVVEEVRAGVDRLSVEDMWLLQHAGRPECYNIHDKAFSPRTGAVHTPEACRKISEKLKGMFTGDKHYRFGKKLSPAIRKKIGDTQRGRPKAERMPMSAQGRANLLAAAAERRGVPTGRRPSNAEDLQKAIRVQRDGHPDEVFPSLSNLRDTKGLSLMTIIRACKSGKVISKGPCAGWLLSYADAAPPTALATPDNVPRTRAEAQATGVKFYFTGAPCSRGHLSLRKTKGSCVTCEKEDTKVANEKRRGYFRGYNRREDTKARKKAGYEALALPNNPAYTQYD